MVDSNPSFEVVGSPGDFQTFFVVSVSNSASLHLTPGFSKWFSYNPTDLDEVNITDII